MTQNPFDHSTKPGLLEGLRVVETADELGEYCGLLLAGLGAEVIKIESMEGSPTRGIGPFYEDVAGPERSLFFWAYNRGKKSVQVTTGEQYLRLVGSADILLDSTGGGFARGLGVDPGTLATLFPALITARLTPFGDVGPWKDWKASDLVHLALGGIMMDCGYDMTPDGRYDLPPIAPQMWHAYHIAGEQLAVGIAGAMFHRKQTGQGQDVSCAVHQAVSTNTEIDNMTWIMRRAPVHRQTGRHAVENPTHTPNMSYTKDGRWVMSCFVSPQDKNKLAPYLDDYGMAADLKHLTSDADVGARYVPGSSEATAEAEHMQEVIQRFVRAFCYSEVPWRKAQEAGLFWAPIRKPHENALDEHWLSRRTFSEIEHPELGRSFRYPTSKWLSTATSWQPGRRAPLLGEHTDAVLAAPAREPRIEVRHRSRERSLLSPYGTPFPLAGVRIFDFSWFLASAGGTRLLASMGAESLKVEWKTHPDTRLAAMAPIGGRAAREAATAPLKGVNDSDMGGQFNNKNAGKRGLSLNVRHPKGLRIAKDLIRQCDIVAEGFSPGVLERIGLGYDVLRSIRPDIIYVQQSGMGGSGIYGRFRTVGPVAASFAGATDMSGLPEPAAPAGWGYSYLDWSGVYGFALATIGALLHRERTGEGQMIDSSQCEAGIFQTAVAVLDWSANGRTWSRYGNRSPYKLAAPHGAYRCRGEDRWLAIACFSEPEWIAFTEVADLRQMRSDARFATLASRLRHQDALDEAVTRWTATVDAYDGMARLQEAGVAAGVCQTAADRCDTDPQLRALDWLTEVTGSKIGRWPVPEFPVKLSRTPPYAGGPIGRGAPCYGEDNRSILREMLGYSEAEIDALEEEEVI